MPINSYYPRQLEQTLSPWLNKNEGILLAGARQTGKTTLLKRLQENYPEAFFISFEEKQTLAKAQNDPQGFLAALVKSGCQTIFIDEFQKVPEITSAIKLLYDHTAPKPKFFLSGSVSDYIYKKEGDSMVGRVMRFQLFTLSFQEFLKAKNIRLDALKLVNEELHKFFAFLPLDSKKLEFSFLQEDSSLQNLFEEYLLSGGYPASLPLTSEQKPIFFENLQSSFWEKDLFGFLRRRQLASLQQLMIILAKRVAFPLSLQSLAQELQLDPKTVLNLIYLLKYSFWLDILYPKSSFGGEYRKKFKIYFQDMGLRNYFARATALLAFESGPALENLVFGVLKRFMAYENYFCNFNYWQTYAGGEVDFVLERNAQLLAIEVKSEALKKEKISKGMLAFIKKYKPAAVFQLNRNFFGQKKVGQTWVYFLPVWCFALLI